MNGYCHIAAEMDSSSETTVNNNNHLHADNKSEFRPTDHRAHKDSSEEILKEMALQKVRKRMENLQTRISEDIDKKLEIMVEELIEEVKKFNFQNNEYKNLFQDEKDKLLTNRKQQQKAGHLPEKQFMARNSILTDLFEVKHINTIYHIFIVMMIITFLNTMVHDLVADGTINLGLRPMKVAFGKFHIALMIWTGMQLSSTLIYYFFKCWSDVRFLLRKNPMAKQSWDIANLIGFIIYQLSFSVITIQAITYFDLPHASSFSVLLEMTRFVMKIHAFVRTNAAKVIRGKQKSDINDTSNIHFVMPSMKTYQYFLFCPTLIYRDSYPRTKHTRWGIVFKYFLEVLATVLYLSFIFERFMLSNFSNFGEKQTDLSSLVLSIFGCMMPSTLFFLIGFYCLLHCWMNGWAEILRFADRMFYQDWWTSTSFDAYYRKWNVVVHDWLYTYIYKDLYETVFRRSKTGAALAVFTISAIIHEIILAFAFRFCYPVLFIMFEGAGVFLMFVTKKHHRASGNIIMWLSLCLGNGLQFSLYTMEHFARQNCTMNSSIWNYFIPVSWSSSCHGVSVNPNWTIKHPWTST